MGVLSVIPVLVNNPLDCSAQVWTSVLVGRFDYFRSFPVVVTTSFPCLTPRIASMWSAKCCTSPLLPFIMTTSRP